MANRDAPTSKAVDVTSQPGEQTEATSEGHQTFDDKDVGDSPSDWAQGRDAHNHFVPKRQFYPEDGLNYLASVINITA